MPLDANWRLRGAQCSQCFSFQCVSFSELSLPNDNPVHPVTAFAILRSETYRYHKPLMMQSSDGSGVKQGLVHIRRRSRKHD